MALCSNEVIRAYDSVLHKPFTPQNRVNSMQEIELNIQRQYPQGVDAVVYCKSSVNGWSQMPSTKGIIAILIGLIVPPAAAREAGSGLATGRRQHLPFLKPTGSVGYAIELGGAFAGVFHTITWV